MTTLRAELAGVEAQLGRVDTKAGIILGLAGAGATAGPVIIPGAHLPFPAAFAAWTAVAFLVTAAGCTILAMRPQLVLRSRARSGFALYAQMTPARLLEILETLHTPESLARRVVDLSILLDAKYTWIRRACNAMLLGIVMAVVAGSVTFFLK